MSMCYLHLRKWLVQTVLSDFTHSFDFQILRLKHQSQDMLDPMTNLYVVM
jgi:hypothetical protein